MSVLRKCTVKLLQGSLVGAYETLPNGKQFAAFRGIPYAQPPVGPLRFKPPVPIESYPESFDCTEDRDVCLQLDLPTKQISGSEDCLFLSVYTPSVEDDVVKKFPVMIFIHGGGFATGGGNSKRTPGYLVQEDVVLIMFNYRLGPLGFMHLPSGGITGNAGLYDQRLVFKWAKENIDKFNGDPDNITVFGESAGGAAASIHYVSPLSRQYFNKVICQSGTFIMDWVVQTEPTKRARKLASMLGCTSDDEAEIGEFLQNANATQLVVSTVKTLTADDWSRGLPFPFTPVIETEDIEDPVFPHDFGIKKDDLDIPIVVGYNSMEGLIMLINNLDKIGELNNDPARFIPQSVNIDAHSEVGHKLGDEIKKFYFGDEIVGIDTIRAVIDLMSDFHFIFGHHKFMDFLRKTEFSSKVYHYRFSFDGGFNFVKQLVDESVDVKGACHADELYYLFGSKFNPLVLPDDSDEVKLRTTMCRMWKNFANVSNPQPQGDDLIQFIWDQLDGGEKDTLEISNDGIEMVANPEMDRYQFWKNIYDTYNGDSIMGLEL